MIFTPIMLRRVIIFVLYSYSISVYSFTENTNFVLIDFESERTLYSDSYHFYSSNLFALSASNDSPVCGDGTQNVTLSVNGAAPLNSIVWYDEDDNMVGNGNPLVLPNVTTSFAGNYYAIEYNPGLAIVQTSNVTNVEISEVSSDNAYAGEDQHLCYGTTLTNLSGAEPVVGSGYWTADAGNTSVAIIVNPTLGNTIISDLVTGSYTFRWTLSNGACSNYDYDEVIIIVGGVLPAPTYFGDEGVCEGGFLFMQGNNAPVGATYNWEGPNGFTSDDQNLYFPSANINNGGEYALTYITTDGCESLPFLQNIDIFYFQDFSTIIFDGPICMGDTLKLDSPTNGVVYEWIGPDGESANTLSDPLLTTAANFTRIPFGEDIYKAGFWKVRVTDMNGCIMDSDSINVAINSIPNNPLIEAPSNICEGEDLQLQAPSFVNTNYNWYQTINGNPDSVLVSQMENPIITGLTSSDSNDPYVFCLKVNEAGCESKLLPELNAVQQNCAGLANLTTYSIPFSGFNNITFSNIGGVLWQMDYVHTGGNTIAQTMENVWIDSIAKGGTIQFNKIFAVGGGKVRLELIKDANWTSFTRNGENYSIQFLYLSDPDITGYLKYFIVCPEYPFLGHNTPNFDGTAYITYVNRMIFQTVENIETNILPDGLSCRAVTVSEIPTLNPTHNGGICGDSLRLFSNVTEVYPPYYFYWTGPNGFISYDENPVISNPGSSNEGSYLLAVTDSLGCSNVATVNVNMISGSANQPIISSNLPLCEGDNLILNTLQISGDSISYFWFGPNGKSTANGDYPNASMLLIENVTSTDIGNYSVNITANTCTSINSIDLFININENPQLNPTASMTGITCVSDTSSVDLLANAMGGTSPYSYTWNGPDGFNSNVGNVLLGNLNEEKSGSYSVITTDANGCQSETGQVNLGFLDRPNMPIISSQGSTCFGEQLVLSVPYYSGSSVSYNWFLDGIALNNNSNILVLNSVSLSNSGTYEVFITVDGCDSDTSSLEIIINSEIEISLSDVNLDCQNGGNDLTLSASVIGGSGSYNYEWTGPNGFFSTNEMPLILNATSLQSGSYVVRVIDSFGCESLVKSMTVNISDQLDSPNLQPVGNVCEGEEVILSTQIYTGTGISYHWLFNGVAISNAYANTNTFLIDPATPANSGLYQVFIEKNGCSTDTAEVMVNVNEEVSVTLSNQNFSCVDASTNASLTANVSGGTPPYSFSWNGPNGFISDLENPIIPVYNSTSTNIYSVTISDSLGCFSNTASAVISISSEPTQSTIFPVGNICHGTSVSLETQTYAGTNVFYDWSFNGTPISNNSNVLILNPASSINSGIYEVKINVDGCESNSTNISILVNEPILTSINTTSLSCITPGSDLTLSSSASGGNGVYTYLWTGPNGFASTDENPVLMNVTTLQSGAYTLVVTDELGCESAATIEYISIFGSINQPLIISNGASCENVNVLLQVQEYVGNDVSYEWTFNGNIIPSNNNELLINSATAADAGDYQLEITVDGCTNISNVYTLEVFEKPQTLPTNDALLCANLSANLNLFTNPSGGTPPYNFSWAGSNGFISNDENPILPNANASFSGTYNITVTDANGCSTEASTVVEITNQPEIPTINLISNGFLCEGETLELTTNSYSGNSVIYTWSTPSGNFTTTNPTLIIEQVTNANQDGIYSVSVDVEGCISQSSAQINIDVVPTPSAPNVPIDFEICENDALVLTTATVADSYEWTGPNGFFSTLQSPTVIDPATPLESGVYQLVIASFGCESLPSQVEVIVHEAPSLPTILSNSPVCSGEDIMLSTAIFQAGYTYEWIGPLGDDPIVLSILGLITNVPNITITNSSATYLSGDWKVIITDVQGCSSESIATTNVNIINLPANPTASNNGPKCYGEDIQLFAGGVSGASYFWFDGDPNASPAGVLFSTIKDPIIYNLPEGIHDFWLKIEKNGCESENTTMTEVVVKPLPEINGIAASNTFCEGELIEIQAPSFANGTFHWTGPNGFQSFDQNLLITSASPLNTGVYSLQVGLGGCSSALVSTSINVTSQPVTPTVSNNGPGCEGMDIQLFGSTSMTGQVVEYLWTGPNGFTSNIQNPILPATNNNQSGEYLLELIVDECSSLISAPTMVEVLSSLPSPSIDNNTITNIVCEGEAVLLTTDFIAGANYFWTGPNGFNSTFQNPIINESDILDTGLYYLAIDINGCSSIISPPTQVNILSIPNAPVAINNGPACEGNTISLIVPTTNTGTIYSWYQSATNLLIGVGDTLELINISLNQTGDYYVIANNGGCDSEPSLTTEIMVNNSPNQSAFAGNNFSLCGEISTILDAIPPVVGTGEWTSLGNAIIVNPASSNSPVFNLQEGSNIFIWTLSNGDCGAYSSDTLEIFGSIEASDLAEAGLDQNLCGVSDFNLLATPPNQAIGLWTQPNIQQSLGITIIDPTDPNSMVTGANQGNTYVFYWSLSNGVCENYSEDEVLISIDEGTQDNAYAGENIFHCGEASLVLNATTPLQGEGSWTTNSDAQIISPINPSSLVVNLQEGENVFYWTLENGNCSNLSMDSMIVFSLEKPIAVADVDTLLWNTRLEQMAILINDDYIDSNIEITIVSLPSNGIVAVNNDGTINYTPNENFIGTEFFEYQICNVNCPNQCDIAEVEIVVKREDVESAVDCFIPSIITPNGDGTNDAFVTPCAVVYPNSKLQVFNRWGDEVYSRQPYNNDWKGTYNEFPLPDGSYFYILNLDDNPKNMLSGYIIIRN